MSLTVPYPYRMVLAGKNLLVARVEALEPARRALAGAGSLFQFAAAHSAAERLEGRGPALVVPMGAVLGVVRHYRRGGAAARWLGDRYLRVGVPRPLRELLASRAVAERGIPTPAVLAAAVYPAGVFYRGDVVTSYIPDSTDLARALFGDGIPAGDRVQVCIAAGELLRRLREAGVLHADLNLKNILLEWSGRPPRVYLLDLDRCRVVERLGEGLHGAMLERFWRSVRKWERHTGRVLTVAEREALQAE
ncbi:MAG: hypothetical protein HY703_11935 [Gemmatimonadetes bacterium]|nr:hypothetical protein [Gemmatimonadota bacterium]